MVLCIIHLQLLNTATYFFCVAVTVGWHCDASAQIQWMQPPMQGIICKTPQDSWFERYCSHYLLQVYHKHTVIPSMAAKPVSVATMGALTTVVSGRALPKAV